MHLFIKDINNLIIGWKLCYFCGNIISLLFMKNCNRHNLETKVKEIFSLLSKIFDLEDHVCECDEGVMWVNGRDNDPCNATMVDCEDCKNRDWNIEQIKKEIENIYQSMSYIEEKIARKYIAANEYINNHVFYNGEVAFDDALNICDMYNEYIILANKIKNYEVCFPFKNNRVHEGV